MKQQTPAKNPHAQALGKLGGSVSSPKKAAAARRNGRKYKGKQAQK